MEFGNRNFNWARSSVGLERTPDKREVGSSNLPGPIVSFELLVLSFELRLRTKNSGLKTNMSGDVAQLGERRLCKPEVVGSSPIVSKIYISFSRNNGHE